MAKHKLVSARMTDEALAAAPVNYRSIRLLPRIGATPIRLAESSWHRAKGFVCRPFLRPISKCIQMEPSPVAPSPGTGDKLSTARTASASRVAEPQVDARDAAYDDLVFKMFACCYPVRGARRSVVCDLQRAAFRFIPNGLYDILTAHDGETVGQIKAAYDHEYDQEVEQYFEFLIGQEFGFWCDDPEAFPPLDLDWEAPQRITNAILDVDAQSAHDYPGIFRQLDELGCPAIEVRFFSGMSPVAIREVLAVSALSRLRSIDLLGPYSDEVVKIDWPELARKFQRLHKVFLHSAPEDRIEEIGGLGTVLLHRRQRIDSPSCCGEVHAAYFVTNMATFTESQSHNSCLNRKISVDATGEIKNCPSLADSYGNVRETTLSEALVKPGFQRLWNVTKDQIKICKDCEFRYICTDCRAYTQDPEDPCSKPSKCRYDPYTAQWE